MQQKTDLSLLLQATTPAAVSLYAARVAACDKGAKVCKSAQIDIGGSTAGDREPHLLKEGQDQRIFAKLPQMDGVQPLSAAPQEGQGGCKSSGHINVRACQKVAIGQHRLSQPLQHAQSTEGSHAEGRDQRRSLLILHRQYDSLPIGQSHHRPQPVVGLKDSAGAPAAVLEGTPLPSPGYKLLRILQQLHPERLLRRGFGSAHLLGEHHAVRRACQSAWAVQSTRSSSVARRSRSKRSRASRPAASSAARSRDGSESNASASCKAATGSPGGATSPAPLSRNSGACQPS